MAAAAILGFSHQEFCGIVYVLMLFGFTRWPAKFSENFSQNERMASFLEIKDGGSRHVRFWIQDVFGIVDVLLFRFATYLPNMVKICRKMNE